MIISVNGFEEAKAYPVMFNTTELLMDNTKDQFYVKAVDRMGKYTINTYEFHQVENEKPITTANFVSKEQFNELNEKLDKLMAQLSTAEVAPDSNTKQGRVKNA